MSFLVAASGTLIWLASQENELAVRTQKAEVRNWPAFTPALDRTLRRIYTKRTQKVQF